MQTAQSFEERFFSGNELYGDDFDAEEIAQWFADEEHGYAELYGSDQTRHEYEYEALNVHHGFSRVSESKRLHHVLGFGSNFGDELVPILNRVGRVTLLDASDRYVVNNLRGIPVSYVLASASGDIALESASVDLITCFGVLHHIPNVSKVVSEFSRILAPGGLALIREPSMSMGDWRSKRRGLTARERGIPKRLLIEALEGSGLTVRRASDCDFRPWVQLLERLGLVPFKSGTWTAIDAALARAFAWNYRYHRTIFFKKFSPGSTFCIAEKVCD
jgi:SAM-dependent methyltransferase